MFHKSGERVEDPARKVTGHRCVYTQPCALLLLVRHVYVHVQHARSVSKMRLAA